MRSSLKTAPGAAMLSAIAALSWFFWFKAAVFVLLALNVAQYLVYGTFSEALDTAAWLVLLMLFELETGHGERLGAKRARVVHAIRLAAAAAVLIAAVGYVHEEDWLGAINAWLWIAVVVLLEFEVRHPSAVGQRRALFVAVAAALYSGLAALVLLWARDGEWLDAYDALLWLIAFVMIEINVLGLAGRRGSSAPASTI